MFYTAWTLKIQATIRTSVIMLAILCLLRAPVFAQDAMLPAVSVAPEAVGISSSRLDRMQTRMNAYVDEGRTAGILTMVARRGQTVHFETHGMRDKENGLKMEHDTIFRIYSMTKPITSVAVMMLFEEGHFQLNDPVHRYIPAFKDIQVYDETADNGSNTVQSARPVTIRDLLTHTSGLTYGVFGNSPVDIMYREAGILRPDQDLESMVDALGKIPLIHQPGTKWNYSVSTDVLGYLVEVVSGQPFGDFLEDRIFGPLGMKDTGFEVPKNDLNRFANNYRYTPEGELVLQDGAEDSRFAGPITFYSGGGGLVSTAQDYFRFAQMLLNGGELDGKRLLGLKTVELMAMNHLEGEWAPGRGFGLGVSVVTDVAKTQQLGTEGTYGWSGLAKTYFFIDPEEELIAMVWTQLFIDGAFPLADEFATGVYQAIVE